MFDISLPQVVGLSMDMSLKRSFIILVFVVSTIAFVKASSSDKILLSDLKVITLHQGRMTNARRSSSVPQLKCVGGSAQHKFQPRVVQCKNQGSDGYDIQWECKTDMDNAYRFGHVGVNCEGYDYPNDPFVLKGSCGLEYTIEFTEEGRQREDQRGSKSYSYGSKHDSDIEVHGGVGGLFVFLAILFVIFVIYKACLAPDTPGYHSHRETPTAPPQPPPYGFRPEFTGQDYASPPPYESSDFTNFSNTPGYSSHYSTNSRYPQGNSGNGFWSGAATGGILGYLFGSSRNHNHHHHHNNHWGHSDRSTHRDNSSGFSSSPPPSPSSSGTRTASGFGGTSRR